MTGQNLDFLEFLVKLLEENNADVAICGAADKAFDEKKVMTGEEAVIELLRPGKSLICLSNEKFTKCNGMQKLAVSLENM